MKIIERETENEYSNRWELELETKKGTKEISFGEGEPEDNTLYRDLSDVYNIADLLEMAYNAGKAGEEFSHIKEKLDD